MQIRTMLALAAAGAWFAGSVRAATITEDFTNNPAADGWQVFGDTNLFKWDSANHVLDVTWDSSQTNSYFYHSLGTILSTNDDFAFSFDLTLFDYAIGVDPNNLENFEVATGLLNFGESTNAGYLRGSYLTSQQDLAEFDFFQWDDVPPYPATNTVWPTLVDSLGDYYYYDESSYGVVELPTNTVMRVGLNYTAASQTCVLTITTNGQALLPPVSLILSDTPVTSPATPPFSDYHLDSFAVESYSGLQSGGSLLAHGAIGHIVITVPAPPVTLLEPFCVAGTWQVQFGSVTNWNYLLQSSSNLVNWSADGAAAAGAGGAMILQDTNSPQAQEYFRVEALRKD